MRVKRNILIFIAIVLIVCYGIAAFMSGYYLAKQEDKEQKTIQIK